MLNFLPSSPPSLYFFYIHPYTRFQSIALYPPTHFTTATHQPTTHQQLGVKSQCIASTHSHAAAAAELRTPRTGREENEDVLTMVHIIKYAPCSELFAGQIPVVVAGLWVGEGQDRGRTRRQSLKRRRMIEDDFIRTNERTKGHCLHSIIRVVGGWLVGWFVGRQESSPSQSPSPSSTNRQPDRPTAEKGATSNNE